MAQKHWVNPSRKYMLCVDSYDNNVLQGRFYTPALEMEAFTGLMEFLVKMENTLDELQAPQSYTLTRKFAPLPPSTQKNSGEVFHKGKYATFEIQILFRQHSSWQGVISWQDENMEQSFRSVLELILLIDSALRKDELENDK